MNTITMHDWNIENITGYKPCTTFYMDFDIADHFGASAIRETYKSALQWKSDVKYMTELVMVLNWKIWEHYERNNHTIAKLYDELWEKAQALCVKTFKGDDLMYYYATID